MNKKLAFSVPALCMAAAIASVPSLHAAPVTVNNFSFEGDNTQSGATTTTVPTGWIGYNEAGGNDFGSQHPSTGSGEYTSTNPLPAPADGGTFAYINVFNNNPTGGIYQDVGALLANTSYTLTVAIGSRNDRINSPGIISLYNGTDFTGTLLASGGGLPGTQNTFQDFSTTFTTGANVTGDLTVGLSVAGATSIQADFDNVRLDATGSAAVPEPSTWAMLLPAIAGAGLLVRRARRASV